MNEDVLSFSKIRVNHDVLNEVWTLDPRSLDTIAGPKLSSYAMALSQYIIYFVYEKNKTKAAVHKLTRHIDRTVTLILSTNEKILKEHKTKTAAKEFIISTDMSLMEAQTKLDKAQLELMEISGMEKHLSELVATIKRELTRREKELYSVRMERK
jgi:hypothetical protein